MTFGITVTAPRPDPLAETVPGRRRALVDFSSLKARICLAAVVCAVASLAIEVSQRQSAHAALFRGADLGQFHQAIPEPVAVNSDIGRHLPSLPAPIPPPRASGSTDATCD